VVETHAVHRLGRMVERDDAVPVGIGQSLTLKDTAQVG
jgi:hypothetical protein